MTLTSPMIELVSDLSQADVSRRIASLTEGDWIVTARVVDCAGPFGVAFMQFSNATYDLKITDKATGEMVLALHTRHIGGRDVSSDFIENTGKFLGRLTEAEKLYGMGETIAAADARHKEEEATKEK